MIDIWAGGSLTFIFKEILKDTLDQFRNQLKFGEFWVVLLYVLVEKVCTKKKNFCGLMPLKTNRSPPENVKQTVVPAFQG